MGALERCDAATLAERIASFAPAMTVIATAPTYLFWRCAQPELRIPRELALALDGRGGRIVAVGPHGSATPGATLRKLGADIVVRGECEEVVTALAAADLSDLSRLRIDGVAFMTDGEPQVIGPVQVARFNDAPALHWPDAWIAEHHHHHHRFEVHDGQHPGVYGAETEASRGCPYSCTFCAKIDFRDTYRRREIVPLLEEIDALVRQGVGYVYFIDEIFLPRPDLLDALTERELVFGVQTRIDLWQPDMLARLGKAGCVSIEAGMESISEAGRAALDKRCRLDTGEMTERLLTARRYVPFVQANLIATADDDAAEVAAWRERLQRHDVWANDPVPLFPYPSSPDYRNRWGAPDDAAWERAHDFYLERFRTFSDIQDEMPSALGELESCCGR